MRDKTVITIASGLGLGYSPFAPGTAGTLLGLPLAYLFAGTGLYWYAALTLLVFAAGVWAAGRAEVIYGQKDSGRIVIDEVAGMLVTMYTLPVTPFYLVVGFFLFRFFDILKPFPARRIDQRMGGGLGVMLDDVAAAVYANLCLQAVRAYSG
ncbi:MAG: phosphatidylglycerophosphatase A [Nitrospirae bacterium]|nr:phosphatidylglycerophosphatase A [Nitrospirota bacterium]